MGKGDSYSLDHQLGPQDCSLGTVIAETWRQNLSCVKNAVETPVASGRSPVGQTGRLVRTRLWFSPPGEATVESWAD